MSKNPAFLFYPGDWLGGTMGMSFEQKGCYIELLIMQYNKGSFTEEEVQRTLSVSFSHAWPTLSKKFETDGKVYWNARLKEEIEKRANYIESRRLSGLTPKKQKAHAKAYAKHTHKRGENENENENRKEKLNIGFTVFWDLYAKKEDREKCEFKWSHLTDAERELCIKHIPAYVTSTPDKKFRKNPLTYLNNKAWENEIINPFPSKISLPKTYEEMLEMADKDPGAWKRYKAIIRPGERKAVYVPIEQT